jgi:hypothetical protein
MSWTVRLESAGNSIVQAAYGEDKRLRDTYTQDHAAHEAYEQFTVAVTAAQTIIDSGAVGAGPYTVTLAGHANPGHANTDGWANDIVTVSVHRE